MAEKKIDVEIKIGGKYGWEQDPFQDKDKRITVIDIKSGWCKYVYGGPVWLLKFLGITFTTPIAKAEKSWYYWGGGLNE